jgi:hypothetical protein
MFYYSFTLLMFFIITISEWMPEVGNDFRGDETAAEKILEEQFREEEKAGRMFPLSKKEAARRYPGRALTVAAQGILEKPDGGHRIIRCDAWSEAEQ